MGWGWEQGKGSAAFKLSQTIVTLVTKVFCPELLSIIGSNYMTYKKRRKCRELQRLDNSTATGQVEALFKVF